MLKFEKCSSWLLARKQNHCMGVSQIGGPLESSIDCLRKVFGDVGVPNLLRNIRIISIHLASSIPRPYLPQRLQVILLPQQPMMGIPDQWWDRCGQVVIINAACDSGQCWVIAGYIPVGIDNIRSILNNSGCITSKLIILLLVISLQPLIWRTTIADYIPVGYK